MMLNDCRCGEHPRLIEKSERGYITASIVCVCGEHTCELTGMPSGRRTIVNAVVGAWNSRDSDGEVPK